MRTFKWRLLLPWIAITSTTCLSAQSSVTDSIAATLRQRITTGPLILSDFNAASVIHISVHDDRMESSPSLFHSFSVLKMNDLKVNASVITLKGTKSYLLRRSATELVPFAATEPVEIDVQLGPGISETYANEVASHLFFPDLKAALQAIPSEFANLVPGRADPGPVKVEKPKQTCDCNQSGTPACENAEQQGRKRAELLRQVDAQFNMKELTSRGKVQVFTAISVSRTGDVSNVWILRASTAASAADAANAVRRYKFSPATCHGSAVPDYMNVQVDGQAF